MILHEEVINYDLIREHGIIVGSGKMLSLCSFQGNWQDKTNWADVIDWYTENMMLFYNNVYPIWEKVQKKL